MTKAKPTALMAAAAMMVSAAALGTGFRAAPVVAAKPSILVVTGDSVSATEGCVSTSDYARGSMIVFGCGSSRGTGLATIGIQSDRNPTRYDDPVRKLSQTVGSELPQG